MTYGYPHSRILLYGKLLQSHVANVPFYNFHQGNSFPGRGNPHLPNVCFSSIVSIFSQQRR